MHTSIVTLLCGSMYHYYLSTNTFLGAAFYIALLNSSCKSSVGHTVRCLMIRIYSSMSMNIQSKTELNNLTEYIAYQTSSGDWGSLWKSIPSRAGAMAPYKKAPLKHPARVITGEIPVIQNTSYISHAVQGILHIHTRRWGLGRRYDIIDRW